MNFLRKIFPNLLPTENLFSTVLGFLKSQPTSLQFTYSELLSWYYESDQLIKSFIFSKIMNNNYSIFHLSNSFQWCCTLISKESTIDKEYINQRTESTTLWIRWQTHKDSTKHFTTDTEKTRQEFQSRYSLPKGANS